MATAAQYAALAAQINADLDALGGWPQSALRMCVSPTGNDANNGLSPNSAKATIAAAYAALKTYAEVNITPVGGVLGVGTIQLLPGKHDVGSGFAVTYRRPVVIQGMRSGNASANQIAQSASIIYSSSTSSPTSLITYGNGITGVAFGLELQDVVFELSPSHTAAVRLNSVNHFHARGCGAYAASGLSQNSYFVDYTNVTTLDGSWGHLIDNQVAHMGLVKGVADTQNYWRVRRNIIYFGTLVPAGIYFTSSVGALVFGFDVSENHLEAGATAVGAGIYVRGANQCSFFQNTGEMGNGAMPFYDLGGIKNVIMGGWCSKSGTPVNNAPFLSTTPFADYNTFILPGVRAASDVTATNQHDRFVDGGSTHNTFIGGGWSVVR